MKLNLKSIAKVKLTIRGREIYIHQRHKVNLIFNQEMCPPEIDAVDQFGFLCCRMDVLMILFGECFRMNLLLPFESEIEIKGE